MRLKLIEYLPIFTWIKDNTSGIETNIRYNLREVPSYSTG